MSRTRQSAGIMSPEADDIANDYLGFLSPTEQKQAWALQELRLIGSAS